jgi:hypothetical protein
MRRILILSLFIASLYNTKIFAYNLIKVENSKNSYRGITVKENNKYYIYLTQKSLLLNGNKNPYQGYKKFQLNNLQLAKYSDLARFQILGELAEYSIINYSKSINFATEFQIENFNGKILKGKIIGIGINYFETNLSAQNVITGTPAETDKEIFALAANPECHLQINEQWCANRIQLVKNKHLFLSRLNKNFIWEKPEFESFEALKKYLIDSEQFIEEYINIVNYWCENPYRVLSKTIDISSKLKNWKEEHNNRTKSYSKILSLCKEKPIRRKGIIYNLIKNTLTRGTLLKQYARTKNNQFKLKQPSEFLRDYSNKLLDSWHKIDKMLELRIKNLEFMLPYQIEKYLKKRKSKIIKIKNKKSISKIKLQVGNTDHLLILKSGIKHFLIPTVKFDKENYILIPQSFFLNNIQQIKVFNLYTGDLVHLDYNKSFASDNLIRIKINSNSNTGFNIAPASTKTKFIYSMNAISSVVHLEPIKGVNLNKNLKDSIQNGGIICDTNNRLIGLAIRNDTLFAEKSRFKLCRLAKEKWKPIQIKHFIKEFTKIKKLLHKTKNLAYIENSYSMNKFNEIKMDILPVFIPLMQEINKCVFKHKLMRITSHGAPLGKHKYLCQFYTILLRLNIFNKIILNTLMKNDFSTLYLNTLKQKIINKNQYLRDNLKKKINKLLKSHPEVALTL